MGSTGSSQPTSKALQEALEEKTQQVDQSSRLAQDLQHQLDHLQVESEERLHDLNLRVEQLGKDKETYLTKLEDKQKELDDHNFRLEEEEINKADLENQSTTDAEKMREMEKKFEENMKAVVLRESAFEKVSDNEELELGLRKSIDDMQSRIYESEK